MMWSQVHVSVYVRVNVHDKIDKQAPAQQTHSDAQSFTNSLSRKEDV